jgi:hypothetical protein
MPYLLAESLHESSSRSARLLGAIRSRAACVVAVAVVVGVVALPHPLPDYPPGVYAAVGTAEGIALAVAAENVLRRPAKRFDLRRASRRVGAVAGAVALFVIAMSALGVALSASDRALLAGFCVAAPAAIAGIDYLKARVRADLRSRASAHRT